SQLRHVLPRQERGEAINVVGLGAQIPAVPAVAGVPAPAPAVDSVRLTGCSFGGERAAGASFAGAGTEEVVGDVDIAALGVAGLGRWTGERALRGRGRPKGLAALFEGHVVHEAKAA